MIRPPPHGRVRLVHEDLLSASRGEALERRVVLGSRAVSALEAFAPKQPAERVSLGFAGDRRQANRVIHAPSLRHYAVRRTSSSPSSR